MFKKVFSKNNRHETFSVKVFIYCVVMAIIILAISFLIYRTNSDDAVDAEIVPATSSESFKITATKSLYSKSHKYSLPSSKLKDLTRKQEEYKPSPDELNLVYFYPENADTSDSINSYAGEIFTELTKINADYYSSYYDLIDSTPMKIASSMSLPKERVIGQYDPRNENHIIKDSTTWTVDTFKNVNVVFKDGDGNKVDGKYIVNELMSLANVYCYYHNMDDPEEMLSYCKSLFKNACTSKVSMGSIYYCSGCLHRSVYDEALEAIAMDTTNAIIYEDDPTDYLSILKQKSKEYKLKLTSHNSKKTDEDDEKEIKATHSDYSLKASSSNYSNSDSKSTDSTIEETKYPKISKDSIIDDAVESKTVTKNGRQNVTVIRQEDIINLGKTNVNKSESEGKNTEAASENADVSIETSELSLENLQESVAVKIKDIEEETTMIGPGYEGFDDFVSESEQNESIDDNILYSDLVLETKGDYLKKKDQSNDDADDSITDNDKDTKETEDYSIYEFSDEEKAISALLETIPGVNSYSSYCPGHIDLYVTITLKGINDQHSIFKIDPIGNDSENFNDEWQGWTDDKIEQAKALYNKDWFETYGLTISSINLLKPLDEEEIDNYLSKLSSDISLTRKNVIEYALKSVGKVPYYWGGKPLRGGYISNNFNTLVSPDICGRILKGLDCSGWVNWVYWSVTGESLDGEGTGTLVACGKKIKRADLKPGDIIIRTGADSHVVMFLCWAENGDMIVIHETGGVINNVTVSQITANWPYYRTLVDDNIKDE